MFCKQIIISNLLVFLIPQFAKGFLHPFDSFKASRKLHGDALRFGSPLHPISSRIAAVEIGRKDEPLSLTLYETNKILHEIDKNDTISTNSSVNKNVSLSDRQKVEDPQDIDSSSNYKVRSATQNTSSIRKSSRGSLLGSYFPFLRSSQTIPSKDSRIISNADIRARNNSVASIFLNKEPNDTITVADLEIFLSQTQPSFYKIPDLNNVVSSVSYTNGLVSTERERTKSTASTKRASTSSHVAFPQPSILSEREIQHGTSLAGCLLGTIIGTTILPNLWLVGMVLGAFYGHEITKEVPQEGHVREDPNIVAKFLISFGKQLAKAYLQLTDYGKAMWFLYKTGQLSYEYYKTYETLDRKFAIQNKVDAWNRVFVEGKQKFDAWEQENEVGRTMLAGLRTAWLVDEQSRKRAIGRSRYRVVQSAYDIKHSISRMLQKTFSSTQSLFQEGGIKTFLNGLRIDMNRERSIATRLGAVGAAIVAVNICGSIFSISPAFSNFVAIVAAVIWPSWATDLVSRTQEVGIEIKSRGHRDDDSLSGSSIQFFDPLKFIRRRCEEQRSDNFRKSKSSKQNYRRRKSFSSKRKKGKVSSSSFFDFIQRPKRKRRGASEEVGTWAFFKRTR